MQGMTTAARSVQFASPSRASTSSNAVKARVQIARRETTVRQKNYLRLAGGLLIIAAASGAVFGLVVVVAAHVLKASDESVARPMSRGDASQAAFIAVAAVFLLTFLVALCTRKESRSDAISQFLETGNRSSVSDENPLASFVLMIAMLGVLYGQFLIIDTIKAAWLGFRLRKADRDRAAVILGILFSTPAGIDPRQLLRMGEDPIALRETCAYLMTYEWVDISPAGDHLNLLSPAKRALKH
jgi:hypothetical protein